MRFSEFTVAVEWRRYLNISNHPIIDQKYIKTNTTRMKHELIARFISGTLQLIPDPSAPGNMW